MGLVNTERAIIYHRRQDRKIGKITGSLVRAERTTAENLSVQTTPPDIIIARLDSSQQEKKRTTLTEKALDRDYLNFPLDPQATAEILFSFTDTSFDSTQVAETPAVTPSKA